MSRPISFRLFPVCATAVAAVPALCGAEAAAEGSATTAAAAAVATGAVSTDADLLEHLVDSVLALFGILSSGNTPTHFIIAGFFLVGSYLLRHVVTKVLFGFFRRLASKTETTLDDELFAATEFPVAALISVAGAVAALKVLKLSETGDRVLGYCSTAGFSIVAFWLFLRAFNAVLDHFHGVATQRQLGIAAFMPWIKKALLVVAVIFGGLMIAQNLGADVKAFLAGLGLGGLAFALAAQDTIANVFGSVVIAIDQPFKIGEYVKIGGHEGTVEDIGLRSTRLRTPARTLIVIPNKAVASEAINNFTRMPQRRVDQTIGLTYDTTPDQMQAVLEDIRGLLRGDPGVHQELVAVHFANYGDSSLDIQVVFFTSDPAWVNHLEVRERINLGIMRLVAARGLSMAFPTRTVLLSGQSVPPQARAWAAR